MKVLNIGSLNFDRVYNVSHFVSPGETILAKNFGLFFGGKGLNQSIAIARAGAEVYHAGVIGEGGETLLHLMSDSGVNVSLVKKMPGETGHAIIQIDDTGENNIIVYGGTNQLITPQYIDSVLKNFSVGDLLLLQNEISNVAYAISAAKKRGMTVAFNVSPITESINGYPMDQVDCFIVNEVEGSFLSGLEDDGYEAILDQLKKRYSASVVLTVGCNGAFYQNADLRMHVDIYDMPVVDTTAAGDTFCGYFIAGLAKGIDIEETLEYASAASGIAVTQKGASSSIPNWETVGKVVKAKLNHTDN